VSPQAIMLHKSPYFQGHFNLTVRAGQGFHVKDKHHQTQSQLKESRGFQDSLKDKYRSLDISNSIIYEKSRNSGGIDRRLPQIDKANFQKTMTAAPATTPNTNESFKPSTARTVN